MERSTKTALALVGAGALVGGIAGLTMGREEGLPGLAGPILGIFTGGILGLLLLAPLSLLTGAFSAGWEHFRSGGKPAASIMTALAPIALVGAALVAFFKLSQAETADHISREDVTQFGIGVALAAMATNWLLDRSKYFNKAKDASAQPAGSLALVFWGFTVVVWPLGTLVLFILGAKTSSAGLLGAITVAWGALSIYVVRAVWAETARYRGEPLWPFLARLAAGAIALVCFGTLATAMVAFVLR